MTATDQLVALALRDTADGPSELIRLCLFDWAVCGVAGRHEPGPHVLAMLATDEGEATALGGGQTSAAMAALINGTAGHALDYDDTHFGHIGHTSAVVMPAVLAVAEDQMLDMGAVQTAALIGSEAAVRTGLWLGRDHYQIGFHQTATAGTFGAAVAAGRLLGLDADRMRQAIGLAATAASGLKGQFGTMGKPLNAGLAARAGVEAALWAQAGMTSDPAGLDQFGATHHGQAAASAWDAAPDWQITQVSHKFHACCHGLHAMLEALRGVTGAVTALDVHTHPRWLSVCNQPRPATGLAAKFSYALTAAMALHGRDTGDIAQFSDATAQDTTLHPLRDAVTVRAEKTLTETQVRVDLTFADGRTDTRAHDLARPLSGEVRRERLRTKADAVLGHDLAAALWSATAGPDLTPLTEIMATP